MEELETTEVVEETVEPVIEDETTKETTENEKPKKKPWYKRPRYIIPLAIIAIILIFNYFSTIVIISGESMLPNFKDGNVLLASRHYDLWRFDVVTIASTDTDKVLIKRVIGLPNETIEFRDNALFVNGEYRTDPYAFGDTEDFTITLGPDEYFCLGDNRENSSDSRNYGPFSSDDIFAKLNCKVYPKKNN